MEEQSWEHEVVERVRRMSDTVALRFFAQGCRQFPLSMLLSEEL